MDLAVLRSGARDAGFTTHEVDLTRVPDESALLKALRGSLRLPGESDWNGVRDALAGPGPGCVLMLMGWPNFRSDHADLADLIERTVRAAQQDSPAPLYVFGLH